MKSILIPTDFSSTASNAANYAIGFAKQMRIDHIILYNTWQPISITDPMSTLVIAEIDAIRETSKAQLEKEAVRLQQIAPLHITIEPLSEMVLLEAGVAELCKKNDIAYIVMGITGGGALDETLIGSNTISISQSTTIPVVIVPKDCTYEYIAKAMFLSDFKDINTSVPQQQIKDFLDVAMPELEVVNFDPDFTREQVEPALEKFALHNILKAYHPQYKYSLRNDFEDAVNEFAENDNVQLIINVAKKRSWLSKILNPSYTNKLAFHTKVPLMVIHT
ncbi:MAG: universal stress protein [Chitinophagaceae bacterium]|nr:universal stress protein [Chitinophagaceae bacterium]